MCDGVGQVGVPEPGVEDRDPGVLCGHVLALDPGHATGVRAGGVQLVVAVLDHRAGRGVLPDGAGLDGDEVAGAEVDGHDGPFGDMLSSQQNSGQVGLGVVGAGLAGGQPLAQPGGRPEACKRRRAPGRRSRCLRTAAGRSAPRTPAVKQIRPTSRRHAGPAEVERAGLGGRDGAAAVADDQGDGLQHVGREDRQRRQPEDEEETPSR